ncbi:MAG: glutaredoxin family protein [Candidatus Dormibacteria bacterium]
MTAEPLRLLTRRGCHLCEIVRGPLAEGARERGLTLIEYDVDEDPGLNHEYGQRVPVLLAGSRILAEGRFDPLGALPAASTRLTDR